MPFVDENKLNSLYNEVDKEKQAAVFFQNLHFKNKDKLNRGDIVIFKNHEKNIDVVKRVIGLPGETVSSENGKVLINNSEIDDIWAKTVTDDFIQQTLGEDEVFVLGDQRRLSSSDSRTLGPVSATECLKIKYRYWPYQRFKAYE